MYPSDRICHAKTAPLPGSPIAQLPPLTHPLASICPPTLSPPTALHAVIRRRGGCCPTHAEVNAKVLSHPLHDNLIAVGQVVDQHGRRHADLAKVLGRHPRRRVALWDRGERKRGLEAEGEGEPLLWVEGVRHAASRADYKRFTDASQKKTAKKRAVPAWSCSIPVPRCGT